MRSPVKRLDVTALVAIVVILCGVGLWVDRRDPAGYTCRSGWIPEGRACTETVTSGLRGQYQQTIRNDAVPVRHTGLFGNDAAIWWWFAAGAVLVVGGVAVLWPTKPKPD